MHEVDRHELDRSESTVDSSHELVDRRSQVLVLLDVLTGRDGELNEDNLRKRNRGRVEVSKGPARSRRDECDEEGRRGWMRKGIKSSPFRSTQGAQSKTTRAREASEELP